MQWIIYKAIKRILVSVGYHIIYMNKPTTVLPNNMLVIKIFSILLSMNDLYNYTHTVKLTTRYLY